MILPRCFGVLGDPVAHSRSPAMHSAAFASLGLPHRYLGFHVAPDRLLAAIAGARALGFGGLNLTVPHKQAALAAVDRLGDAARRIGAVNTVSFVDGAVVGDNTDAPGFVAAARELDPAPVDAAVVLGAGGAALAVVDAIVHELLAPGGVVRWVTRDLDALAPVLAARPWLAAVTPVGYATGAERGADLLVNCTTVGMRGGPTSFPAPIDLAALRSGARVIDAVYPRSPLLDAAAALGHRVQDGLPMLLWQGVRALELWLGQPMPAATIAAMRAAL
jgi:shikimate dehydrogenase